MVGIRRVLVGVIIAVGLVGCATHARRANLEDDRTPAAAVGDEVGAMAGRWQGAVTETGAFYYQGTLPVDLTIAPDWTWTGTIGTAPAAGTATMRGSRLVLEGAADTVLGEDPVHFDLTGDDTRRWGQTLARFGGREARASVSLERTG
jgi:hypothetical protein